MRAGRPRSRVGLLPSLLLLERAPAGLPGRSPCRCGGTGSLGGPSCNFVNHSFFLLFQISAAPAPDDGADHTRVKQRIFMAYPEQGSRPFDPVLQINLLNMDAQDAQDDQDPTLLHERLTPAITASGLADV